MSAPRPTPEQVPPSSHRRRAGMQAGFTLLEVLVAVAILSILASIVPRSFVSARAIIDRSQDWTEARLVAESVLNDELAGNALKPGVRSGTLEGRRWTATLTQNRSVPIGTESARLLLDVHVSVSVGGRITLDLDTTRIGNAQ